MVPEKLWVSFCMSTYKRPELLKKQLNSLLLQTFKDFEVVISDNDPDASAREIVNSINDPRLKYYHNTANLGMIRSFNKSIERASGQYIVMITDDDPVQEDFLTEIFKLFEQNKSCGIYAGFLRKNRRCDEVEFISKETFAAEILDTDKTTNILWSSCVIKKTVVNQIGKIPDYGSPHLADHAFIAMAGSVMGGLVVNRMYGTFTSHNTNFSKSNFDFYLEGCLGFYNTLTNYFKADPFYPEIKVSVNTHLRRWFITNIFSLKRYYSGVHKNKQTLRDIQLCAHNILQLHFMKKYRALYYMRNLLFHTKRKLVSFGFYPLGS